MSQRDLRKRLEGVADESINIAPLIDMVFILLIFFMVSTTFVRDAKVELKRPQARVTTRADSRSVRVTLGRKGEVFINEKPVQAWMLQSRLRQLLGRSRAKTVLVVADRDVRSGRLIEVVDQCRLAGAPNVGVAVDRKR